MFTVTEKLLGKVIDFLGCGSILQVLTK